MKTTSIEKIREAINNNNEKVIMFFGNGLFYAKIDRMTRSYGNLPIRTKMYRDYEKVGDGIYWLLQTATVIKAEYSAKDMMERKWFDKAMTIVDGETYFIIDMTKAPEAYEMVKVKAKVNGDYSDACVFKEVD